MLVWKMPRSAFRRQRHKKKVSDEQWLYNPESVLPIWMSAVKCTILWCFAFKIACLLSAQATNFVQLILICWEVLSVSHYLLATWKHKTQTEWYVDRSPCITTNIRNKDSLRTHMVIEKFFHQYEKHQVVQTLLLMRRIYLAKQHGKSSLLGIYFQCESTAVEPIHMKQRRNPWNIKY